MLAAPACNDDVFVHRTNVDADAEITLSNESSDATELYTVDGLDRLRISHMTCRKVVRRDGVIISDTEGDVVDLDPQKNCEVNLMHRGCSVTISFDVAGRISVGASNNLYAIPYSLTIELLYGPRLRKITVFVKPGEQYQVLNVTFDAFADNTIQLNEEKAISRTYNNNSDSPVQVGIFPYAGIETMAQLFFDDNCYRLMDVNTDFEVPLVTAFDSEDGVMFSMDGHEIKFSDKFQKLTPADIDREVKHTLPPNSSTRVNIYITFALTTTRQEIFCKLPSDNNDRIETFYATMKVKDPIKYRIEYETID